MGDVGLNIFLSMALMSLRIWELFDIAGVQAEGHVLKDSHVGPQRVGLEHQVQVPLGRGRVVRLRRVDDLLAVHVDEAVLGLFQAGHHPQRCGLAAAGGAQQRHEVAVLDGQVQPVRRTVREHHVEFS